MRASGWIVAAAGLLTCAANAQTRNASLRLELASNALLLLDGALVKAGSIVVERDSAGMRSLLIGVSPGAHRLTIAWPRPSTDPYWSRDTIELRVSIAEGDTARVVVPLERWRPIARLPISSALLEPEAERRSRLPMFVAATFGLGAGIATALLKRTADRAYDDFRASGGNAVYRTRADHFDLLSGIALAALEVDAGFLLWWAVGE